jgi:hypothetical protein
MRLKLALLTTVLAFGFGMPAALAEDAPGAKSDITIAGAAPADESAPAAKQDEESQGAPEEGGAVAPDSGDSGSSELPPPASE